MIIQDVTQLLTILDADLPLLSGVGKSGVVCLQIMFCEIIYACITGKLSKSWGLRNSYIDVLKFIVNLSPQPKSHTKID